MQGTLRRSMLWLHSSAGVLLGWLSFLIFLTGSLTYFQNEISQWMQPQLQHPESTAAAVDVALERLRRVAPDASEWFVELPREHNPRLAIRWSSAASSDISGETLNAATGEPVEPSSTLGGHFFYSFHFTLLLPGWGYWLAGVTGMFILVTLISGVVVHRKIFRDFFTFRPRHSPNRAWLDLHNLCSVLALPFHVVIVYSGLITLMFSYMPSIVGGVYGDRADDFFREAFARVEETPAPDLRERIALAELERRVREIGAAGGQIAGLRITAPSTAAARVTLAHGLDARGLMPYTPSSSGAANLYDLLYELHLAQFADSTVRWLLFVSGLAGSAMIATGMIAWTLKRRSRAHAPSLSLALVERGNVAVLAGVLLAVTALFWANRLLPPDLPNRGFREMQCFFAVWALAGLHAGLRAPARAWPEQLWLVAAAFASLPIASGIGTGRYLPASLAAGDFTFIAFDAMALTVAALTGLGARRLAKGLPRVTKRPAMLSAARPAGEPA